MLHYASPAGVWNLCCRQRYSLPSLVSAKISSQAKCGMSHLSYTEIVINQSACLFSNQFLLLQKPFTIILSDLGWWPQRRFTEIISDVTHSTINFPHVGNHFTSLFTSSSPKLVETDGHAPQLGIVRLLLATVTKSLLIGICCMTFYIS